MPIKKFIPGATFDPEAIKSMVIAFEGARTILNVNNPNDPLIEIIAKKLLVWHPKEYPTQKKLNVAWWLILREIKSLFGAFGIPQSPSQSPISLPTTRNKTAGNVFLVPLWAVTETTFARRLLFGFRRASTKVWFSLDICASEYGPPS